MRAGFTKSRSGRGARARGRGRYAACAALAALAGALALCSAPALALSQRGHSFSFSFAAEGSRDGQLSAPAGVAVDEANGDVYVVDAANNRIEQFDSKGGFVAAWGWGVADGKKKYEVCTSDCRAGLAGTHRFEFDGAEAIAVDNSTNKSDLSAGDVYVEAVTEEEEDEVIDKFSPEGKPLAQIKRGPEKEQLKAIHGIAVDPRGNLWVYNESQIDDFGDAAKNKSHTFVEAGFENEPTSELAVDSHGDFYTGHESALAEGITTIAKLSSAGAPLIEELEVANTTGVAVEATSDDVYLDLSGSVEELGSTAAPIQSFGSGHLHAGSGIAVDAATGTVYVADSAADDVDAFAPEPPGAPQIGEVFAQETTATSTVLSAQIDPTGLSTTYAFRYATTAVPSAGEQCAAPACVEAPTPEGDLGEAFADQSAVAHLEGLQAGTTYHYRALARNAAGTAESAELTVTTQAAASGPTLPDGRVWERVSPQEKNGAAIEAITHEGGVIQAAEDGDALTYVATAPFAEAEGGRSPELSQLVSTRSSDGTWSTKDIDTPYRKPEGIESGAAPEYQFFSPNLELGFVNQFGLEPPLAKPATEKTPYLRREETCKAASEESCYVPLVTDEDVTAESKGQKVKFGGSLNVQLAGASPDLRHIVLSSYVPLTDEPGIEGSNLYEWSEGQEAENQLKLVNVLPGGRTFAKEAEAKLGVENQVRGAVSDDGSRVFWSEQIKGSPIHLYVRDMGAGETVQIDKPEAGAKLGPNEKPFFQLASSEGNRVFFTDDQRLTANSTADSTHERPDLYVCEIVIDAAGKLECKLSDLTVDANAGESADVQGLVLGSSNEGSIVYFVANGVLAHGASRGHCDGEFAVPGATCNLYVERYDAETKSWTAPTFIAALSSEDRPDWAPERGDLGYMTSRVSPEGNYLTFMSEERLTGYDNLDVHSDQPDEEVYLYNAATERLVCASCNPTGERPEGVFDTQDSGEGVGLLVDRPEIWSERWLSGSIPGWTSLSINKALYQSRYLFDSGRLFFTSAEALVPQDTNGKEDVYEYEPKEVGSCTEASATFSSRSDGCVALISSGTSEKESAFLDASGEGDDVFFLTAAPLVPQDEDTSFDVYDAAVCGQPGTSACPPAPEQAPAQCDTLETCRQPPEGQKSLPTPASSRLSGSGNLAPRQQVAASKVATKPKTPTRAQKLAAALKACRKHKNKKQRLACEAQARKLYGPAKKAKSSGRARRSAAREGRR